MWLIYHNRYRKHSEFQDNEMVNKLVEVAFASGQINSKFLYYSKLLSKFEDVYFNVWMTCFAKYYRRKELSIQA